MYMEPP